MLVTFVHFLFPLLEKKLNYGLKHTDNAPCGPDVVICGFERASFLFTSTGISETSSVYVAEVF